MIQRSRKNTVKTKVGKRSVAFAIILITSFCHTSLGLEALKPANGAKISILTPINGAIVSTTFNLKLSARRMTIMPANIPHTDSGHYHLVIDGTIPLKINDQPHHAHRTAHSAFEKGQREGALTLSPGAHTVQALLVDHLHRPHNPPLLSEKISITVVAPILLKPAKKP